MSENNIITASSAQQQPVVIAPMQGVNFFDPKQFEVVQRASRLFASSKLVPAMYQIGGVVRKGKDAKPVSEAEAIANCIIALDIASRIGANVLMVMQNLAIIEGRPSWSSKFLIATVNTCGRFEPLKFRFVEKGNLGKVSYTDYVWTSGYKQAVTKEFDGTRVKDLECIAYTTKKGDNELLESSPISLRMAVDEGWYTKNGSKWRTMPRQMLMYRAASFWTNVYAPELSMGMRTIEEQEDIVYADAQELHPDTDAAAEVESEKAANANKDIIDINSDCPPDAPEQEQPAPQQAPAGVDPETGEIKPETPTPKPGKPKAGGSAPAAASAPAY